MNQKLYIMQNENGLYKVGVSVHPDKRRPQVEHMSGVPTKILRYYELPEPLVAVKIEHLVHAFLTDLDYHTTGEWFDTEGDLSMVVYAITCCVASELKDKEYLGNHLMNELEHAVVSRMLVFGHNNLGSSGLSVDHYEMLLFLRYGVKIAIYEV